MRRSLLDLAWFADDLAQFLVFRLDWCRKERVSFDPGRAAARGSTGRALVRRGCSAGVCRVMG
jgi:hypothetical protein